MKTIGILAYQGGVVEHRQKLESLGARVRYVRYPSELEGLDGIIFPGGESTCMLKLLFVFEIVEALKIKLAEGLPVWGTCAGAILLAKEVDDKSNSSPFGFMDIGVHRNAYGSQLDSFTLDFVVPGIAEHQLKLIFIRAPKIVQVGANATTILSIPASSDMEPVAVKEKNFLVTTFHPELDTDHTDFHKYFLTQC